MRPHVMSSALLLCVAAAIGTARGAAQNLPLSRFESAFLFEGRYPANMGCRDWFPDDHEVQGVTHDEENWYFTIVADGTHGVLRRIPKQADLDGDVLQYPGALSIDYYSVGALSAAGFWHWGDPDHYERSGVQYVLVPVYGDGTPNAVACFRASDLQYINYAILSGTVGALGWCAVGVDDRIYASDNNASEVKAYEVGWDALTDPDAGHDALVYAQTYPLYGSDGDTPLNMTDMQGGEFSDSGELLFLVSGRGQCAGQGAPWTPADGIHAIETATWTELAQSVKASGERDYFSYDYDPTCIWCGLFGGWGTETPEGVTYWDLEDGSAPGISGSLHVLVDLWYLSWLCCDELDFHHYSMNVRVDGDAAGGEGLRGTREHPFTSIGEAYSYYPIWGGARLVIDAGSYPERGVFHQRLEVTSEGGVATLGAEAMRRR